MENLPAITVDKVRGELNIALTKAQYSIQAIQSEADALTFSEDEEGLKAAADFKDKVKKVFDVLEAAHKKGKAPAWQECNTRDEANRNLVQTIKAIVDPKLKKHQELANKLATAAKEKAAKEAREKEVRAGVESSIIEYSKRIAAAQTVEELTKIELSISNQKSPSAKAKYGDLHEEAITAYNERIIPLLKKKKEALTDLAKAQERLDHLDVNDVATMEEAEDLYRKIEDLSGCIQDSEVRVQEEALNTTFQSETYKEVVPEVPAKRTTIEFELVNADRAVSKARHLVDVTLNKEACKAAGKAIFDDPTMQDLDEITTNGIRFYKKRVF